jgi:hypothetical protein
MRLKTLPPDSARPSLQVDSCSEKSLAAAVLKQAWHEAVIDLFVIKETTRADYSLLKKEAIEWICGGSDGFVYWCQLADVDHSEVQHKLSEVLRSQRYQS